MSSRALHLLWSLTRESDGPLRRVDDLQTVLGGLSPHEERVLEALIADAVDTIGRLRRSHRDARRGIIR